MNNQADIRDIQILGDLKAAFGRFGEDVLQILPSIQKQFEEVQEWLEERYDHWRRQVDAAQEEVYAARRSLNECESSGYYDDDGDYVAPHCSSEEDRVGDAERHLAECEEHWETVKKWQHRIESQIADFQNDIHRLSDLASTRTGSAQAALAGKIEILNRYVGSFASNVGISGLLGQSGSAKITLAESRKRENPVSRSLQLDIDGLLREQVSGAVNAIDEVHDDGRLPLVPIRDFLPEDYETTLGRFWQTVSLGQNGKAKLTADYIQIRGNGPWPELTTVHETGHLLDLEAFGDKGIFASKSKHPIIRNVLDVAKQSEAIKQLQHKLAQADGREEKHLRYLLKDSEIWARAYAQFVAERSTHSRLKSQLEAALSAQEFRQWTRVDFVPIETAIETMFKNLKWL